MKSLYRLLPFIVAFTFFVIHSLSAQVEKAPPRHEGDGPFGKLIIRGVTLINSTGAPPVGPVDIVVEKNRIAQIKQVGYPGVAIDPKNRPQAASGDKELNCEGMYLMPGFVDMHGHIGGKAQGANAEYVFKLWLGHGITTIRDPGCMNGLDWVLEQRAKSLKNEITAPRIKAYTVFGQGRKGTHHHAPNKPAPGCAKTPNAGPTGLNSSGPSQPSSGPLWTKTKNLVCGRPATMRSWKWPA